MVQTQKAGFKIAVQTVWPKVWIDLHTQTHTQVFKFKQQHWINIMQYLDPHDASILLQRSQLMQ
jgi:hypothetical protein